MIKHLKYMGFGMLCLGLPLALLGCAIALGDHLVTAGHPYAGIAVALAPMLLIISYAFGWAMKSIE